MKTFIFDMDGVIIDSATVWNRKFEQGVWTEFFPPEIANLVNSRVWFGKHLLEPFHYATTLGFKGTAEDYREWIYEQGLKVCATASLSPHLFELLDWLRSHSYRTAIVSSSSIGWVNTVVDRLVPHVFDLTLSLDEHPDLKPKPDPGGYVYAMSYLGSKPTETCILEDSSTGVRAGLASGAHTIWYNRFYSDHSNMPTGYVGPIASLEKLPETLPNLLN